MPGLVACAVLQYCSWLLLVERHCSTACHGFRQGWLWLQLLLAVLDLWLQLLLAWALVVALVVGQVASLLL